MPHQLLLSFFSLIVSVDAQVIRAVPSEAVRERCVRLRVTACRDLGVQMVTGILGSRDFEWKMGRASISAAPTYQRDCLWKERDKLRKGLWINGCVLQELIRLNMESHSSLVMKDFDGIVNRCVDVRHVSTAYQIHTWYTTVLLANIGRDINSIGLRVESQHVQGGRVILWRAPPAIAFTIATLHLERLVEPERHWETESAPDDETWLDIICDQVDDIVKPADLHEPADDLILRIIQSNGIVAPIPKQCRVVRRRSVCHAEFVRSLTIVRDLGMMLPNQELIHRVGVFFGDRDMYQCLQHTIGDFRSGISISAPALTWMLEMNARNAPMTTSEFNSAFKAAKLVTLDHPYTKCDLHIWFSLVVNSSEGETVGDAGVMRVDEMSLVYVPAGNALRRLVEFQLSRLV
jgi:hypothetical protein